MAYGRYDRGREGRDPRGGRPVWDEDRGSRYPGDREERGFFERAGDEVASWFGDDEAQRRREMDERRYEQPGRRQSMMRDDDRYERSQRFRDEGNRRPYARSAGRFERGERYQPMAGDYGRGAERGFSDERFERSPLQREYYVPREFTGSAAGLHDPHYADWRRQQIAALDRDYDEYRRENQSRFESDFSNWRNTRHAKRELLGLIREHMPVVGSDQQHVGTIDKVRGDRVILTRSDSPDGQHHSISCGMIDRVEGDQVVLERTAEEAKASMGSELRDRALFERDDEREPGAHILNRSFSGTY